MSMSYLGYVNIFLLILKERPSWVFGKQKTKQHFFSMLKNYFTKKRIDIFIKFSQFYISLIDKDRVIL